MGANFDQLQKIMSDNLKEAREYKRDMQQFEDELHNENAQHIWFMRKTGFSQREIDLSLLMTIDRETIWEYLEKTQ